MKKILAFIVLLLFLLLLWWSKPFYQKCCGNENNNEKQTKKTSIIKKDGPLVYNWNSSKAITNNLWDAEKTAILKGISDGKILRIVAPYFKEEGKEMGINRAKSAFTMFGNTVDLKRVEFGSRLVEFYENAKINRFGGTTFKWLIKNDNITEIDDKVLIYFPTKSTKKLSNENIKNYLKDVASSLKTNSKKVILSGHTDNTGKSESNKKLAFGRANSIKDELIKLGVNANRITTISNGEEKPIETNDTAIGREKNRRVELEIK